MASEHKVKHKSIFCKSPELGFSFDQTQWANPNRWKQQHSCDFRLGCLIFWHVDCMRIIVSIVSSPHHRKVQLRSPLHHYFRPSVLFYWVVAYVLVKGGGVVQLQSTITPPPPSPCFLHTQAFFRLNGGSSQANTIIFMLLAHTVDALKPGRLSAQQFYITQWTATLSLSLK